MLQKTSNSAKNTMHFVHVSQTNNDSQTGKRTARLAEIPGKQTPARQRASKSISRPNCQFRIYQSRGHSRAYGQQHCGGRQCYRAV